MTFIGEEINFILEIIQLSLVFELKNALMYCFCCILCSSFLYIIIFTFLLSLLFVLLFLEKIKVVLVLSNNTSIVFISSEIISKN